MKRSVEGTPLLMLHGWPADHRLMSHHLEPILQRRHKWRRLYPALLVEDREVVAELPADEQIWLDVAVVQSSDTLAVFREVLKPVFAMADMAFLERVVTEGTFSFDVYRLSAPFTAPTLIVAGRQDGITGYRDAWELIESYPRATFAVLDRAGHDLMVEQQALFRALVNDWLDRVEEFAGR
jgi:pimeloyl-ACP methyl ester carboxylesterase